MNKKLNYWPWTWLLLLAFPTCQKAQPLNEKGFQPPFSSADSLRGSLSPLRTSYKVHFYDLQLDLDLEKQSIKGWNTIHFQVKQGFNALQIDLFENMQIDSIVYSGKNCRYLRKFNAVFVDLGQMLEPDAYDSLKIYYQGQPQKALKAPWDGGFTWTKTPSGKDWVAVSCEGIGASLWWPNKDHLSDKADSARMCFGLPKGELKAISNGILRQTWTTTERQYFQWFVSYPINNYNITLNVANYVHFSDSLKNRPSGLNLALDYYVLPEHLNKAKKHFEQVKPMLQCFEKYLDAYPFERDGYALVETPYVGMEHQGAIAYGNRYLEGYLGRFPPGVPEDFIILHESAHEWWGNSVSCQDHGEMWLHEAFTTYMEAVYVEERYNLDLAQKYLSFYGANILFKKPILGPLHVNYDKHDTDMYYKGSLMLHTLRRSLPNEKDWWGILQRFYLKYKYGSVETADFYRHLKEETGRDYEACLDQYLRFTELPILEYGLKRKGKDVLLSLRWKANVQGFDLPIRIKRGKEWLLIYPKTGEALETLRLKDTRIEDFKLDFGLYENKRLF